MPWQVMSVILKRNEPGPTVAREKIRVAMLIGELGFGGTERQLYLLLSHLNRERFEPLVLAFNKVNGPSLDDSITELGIHTDTIPEPCMGVTNRLMYVYRYLRQKCPDIVHSWTLHDNPYAGLAGRLAGVRNRWGSARLSLRASSFTSLPRLYRWMSLHSVQHIVVNAQSILREIEADGYSRHRISVVPNCVSRHRPLIAASLDFEELGMRESQPAVGVVANFRRTKNLISFVRVMSKVIDQCPSVRGVMVGQPVSSELEVWNEVRQEIESLGLADKIHMAGFCSDVYGFLSRISVLLMTSHYEGTPNAILEAMDAEVPVVAPAIDGIAEVIINGTDGFLYPPGDEPLAASSVVRLLEDRTLSTEISRRAKEKVGQNFSCAATTARYENLYKRALSLSSIPGARP